MLISWLVVWGSTGPRSISREDLGSSAGEPKLLAGLKAVNGGRSFKLEFSSCGFLK